MQTQTYGLDKGMPNVSPWTWASTGSFFAHMGVQGAGEDSLNILAPCVGSLLWPAAHLSHMRLLQMFSYACVPRSLSTIPAGS